MVLSEPQRRTVVNQMSRSLQDAMSCVNELRSVSRKIAPKLEENKQDIEKLNSEIDKISSMLNTLINNANLLR